MYSLLLSIVSIFLVGLLAVSSIFYIGEKERSREAAAGSLLNQAEQIYSARLVKNQTSIYRSEDLSELVSTSHLSDLPRPVALSYSVDSGEPSSSDWSVQADGGPGVFLVSRIQEDVCRFINQKANNTTDISPSFSANLLVQCYGEGPAYTFAYGATSSKNTDGANNTQLPPNTLVSEGSTVYVRVDEPEASVLPGQPVAIKITNDTDSPATFVGVAPSPNYGDTVQIPTQQTAPGSCIKNQQLNAGDSCLITIIPLPISPQREPDVLVDVTLRPAPGGPGAPVTPDSTTQIPISVAPFKAAVPSEHWVVHNLNTHGYLSRGLLYKKDRASVVSTTRYTPTSSQYFANIYRSGFSRYSTSSFNAQTTMSFTSSPFGDAFSFVPSDSSYVPTVDNCSSDSYRFWQGSGLSNLSNLCHMFYNSFGSSIEELKALANHSNGFGSLLGLSANGEVLGLFADTIFVPGASISEPLVVIQSGTVSFSNVTNGLVAGRPKANYSISNYSRVTFPGRIEKVEPIHEGLGGSIHYFALGEDGRVWVHGYEVAKGIELPSSSSSLLSALDPYTPSLESSGPQLYQISPALAPFGGVTWYSSTNPSLLVRQAGTTTVNWRYSGKTNSTYSQSNVENFFKRIEHLKAPQAVVTSAGAPLSSIVSLRSNEIHLATPTPPTTCALALDSSGVIWGAGFKSCWGEARTTYSHLNVIQASDMQSGFKPVFDFSAFPRAIDFFWISENYYQLGLLILREDGSLAVIRIDYGKPGYSVVEFKSGPLKNLRFFRLNCTQKIGSCVGIDSSGVAHFFKPSVGLVLDSRGTESPQAQVRDYYVNTKNCSSIQNPIQQMPCPSWIDAKVVTSSEAFLKGSDGIFYKLSTREIVPDTGTGGVISPTCGTPCLDTYSSTKLLEYERSFNAPSTARRAYATPAISVGFAGGYVPPPTQGTGVQAYAWVINGKLTTFSCAGATCQTVYNAYKSRY